MRLKDIILTANHNLGRSKIRALLTIISIIVGAITLTLTIAVRAGISNYIDKQLGNYGADNVLIVEIKPDESLDNSKLKEYNPDKKTTSSGPLGMAMLTNKNIEEIKKQNNIVKVDPVLIVQPDYAQYKDSKKYVMSIVSYIDNTNLDLIAGRSPDNSIDEHQIILPEEYMNSFGFKDADEALNKKINFTSTNISSKKTIATNATIVGVQVTSLMTSQGATGNSSLLQKLESDANEGTPSSIREQYLALAATTRDGLSTDQINKLKADLSSEGLLVQTVEDRIGMVKQIINAISAVLIFFGVIALFAASFGIINTLYMSVQERTKEIGLMKAMGMSRKKIFLLFSTEAALIGFWGSAVGVSMAFIIGKIVNHYASKGFLNYFTGFNLLEFPLASIIMIMTVIILIAFIASTLPARKASKLNPIDALRYE